MNIEMANEIVMKWQIPADTQRMLINVDKAEICFRRSNGYLSPYQSNTEEKGYEPRQRFEEFAATHKPENIIAPAIIFGFMKVDEPIMNIFSGTHRFAFMREIGVKQMIVGGFYPAKQIAKFFGILIEEPKENKAC